MTPEAPPHPRRLAMSLAGYSLLQPLRQRRSRRFGPGMRREGNCLADENHHDSLPLSEEEEARAALPLNGGAG